MTSQGTPPKVGISSTGAGPGTTAARRVPSAELLGQRGELIIVHAGREYRLRLTHSGKLILTA